MLEKLNKIQFQKQLVKYAVSFHLGSTFELFPETESGF